MATSGSGRGPIKVGSGYIDVFPKLNQKALRETRAEIEKQMGATGAKAGKAFSEGITAEIAKVPKKAAEAAKKAQKELQKSATDSKKVLKKIEQEITKQYGEEAGKRFREAAELEKKKQKLLDQTSASTRRAIQATVKEEQEAARTSAKSWETAEKERLRLIRERVKAAETAAKQEAAAQRQAQQEMRRQLRETLTQARAARVADLHSQMDAQRDQLAGLRNQLSTYRRQIADHTSAVGRSLKGIQSSWKAQGEAIERLGTNITETGRLVSTHLLAPLGAVAGILSTIGVNSADMRILGQMGLTATGVSKQKSASEMKKIQQYAIATPFSIDTMHEYQMKLIRSIAGNDKEWYKKATRGTAANRAASKTSDIIMAVGDTMARAGNLDEGMFQRAMYAVDRIMDMNKAPTRNINQLVQATGIPAGELAQMFGFSSAGAFWKQVGTPVAKGGGISGQDMIDNLLQFWDPNYFVKGKNGKRKINPKTGLPIVNTAEHSTAGGSKGYGERMTSATITGRIQQIKERSQFELGSLFAKENPKTHEYEYTGLGQAIMGKKTGTDKNGNAVYEGGLLQQVQKLGSSQKGNVITLLKTFFEALSTFVKQIQGVSDWLEAHPKVKDAFASILKLGAAVAPFVLALGIATKVLGKVGKLVGAAMTPAKGLFKGVRGATRVGRQVASGVSSRRNGGSFREGYRDRRTDLRGGDTRGPVARTRDRVTGNDSTRNQLTQNIRDTEDAIRDTEDRISGLQRQLRDVNRTSIQQLVNQFAGSSVGSGNGSLQGASQNAGSAVNGAQTQVQQLNRQNLNDISREFTALKDKVEELTKKFNDSTDAVEKLNDKKLTSLKVTVDSAHGTVEDLKNKIDETALSVGKLNERKLGTLRSQQIETTKAQSDKLHDTVSHTITKVSDLNKKSLAALRKQLRDTTSEANKVYGKIKDVISRITTLNGKKLTSVRGEFRGGKSSLYNAVNDVYKLVGTSKSGLTGRISTLNGKSLSKIIGSVKDLKEALDDTGDKAKTLNSRLDDISRHAPGDSSSGRTKKKKHGRASGGILPGYTPGVDVHRFYSPTGGQLDLSGGEAVMRPEWTAAVGPQNVNLMNQVARTKGIGGVRQALGSMKFASGGIMGKLGLDKLVEASDNFNLARDALGSFSTMAMDSTTRRIGGDTQSGVVGSGTDGSHFVGSDIAKKFEGIYNFFTKDSWKILKKLPLPDGFSQVIGILGGALTPIAGQYFWDDVWKGNGNILQRGGAYLNDMFSWKTLKGVVGNLFGGVWDSIKSLFSGGKALITDPVGTVEDSITGLWDLGKSEFDGMIDMVKTLKELATSPRDYAEQVWDDTYSTAKDALPNMKGLFDFSGSHLTAKQPNVKGLIDGELSVPGVGGSVSRWKKQVQMALAQLGLPLSATDLVLHRIQVESGGNPNIVNTTDSNAKAGHPSQGLMQTIPSTFNAYAGPYRGRGITDPMANIYAGLNYAVHRYGSGWQKALSGNKGYWTGTLSASPGLAMVGERGRELVDFGKGGQRVYNNRETEAMLNGHKYEVNVYEAKSEDTTQAVLRGLQWVDSMYGSRL